MREYQIMAHNTQTDAILNAGIYGCDTEDEARKMADARYRRSISAQFHRNADAIRYYVVDAIASDDVESL